jgi:hydrogenase maturation protease
LRVIIGYGNTLRGEDGFGCDVIDELEKYELKNTKLISTFQLTPELCLELLDAKEIIFIDACYLENEKYHYNLGCSIEHQDTNLSHHISPKTIIELLNSVYNKHPQYFIYGMFTNNFDEIANTNKYKKAIKSICDLEIPLT